MHRVLVESFQGLGREAIVAGRDVRASDDLERGISTSSHADVGSLKRAEGSIKGDGLVVRQVGRWLDGQGIRLSVCPSFHRDDGEETSALSGQPTFTVNHLRQFADGASMKDRCSLFS